MKLSMKPSTKNSVRPSMRSNVKPSTKPNMKNNAKPPTQPLMSSNVKLSTSKNVPPSTKRYANSPNTDLHTMGMLLLSPNVRKFLNKSAKTYPSKNVRAFPSRCPRKNVPMFPSKCPSKCPDNSVRRSVVKSADKCQGNNPNKFP